MIYLATSEKCQDINEALRHEWLETNGRGAFASSTIIGANTRRYHGLFSAALDPPRHRILFVNKVEEICHLDGKEWPLSTNNYPGTVFPPGYAYLQEFRQDPFPTWVFNFDGTLVEKRFFLVHQTDLAVLRYRFPDGGRVDRFTCRLLGNFRDIHQLMSQEEFMPPTLQTMPGRLVIEHPGLPSLWVGHNFPAVDSERFWYNQMIYEKDRRRGLDHSEDLFSPCALEWESRGQTPELSIIFSLQEPRGFDPDALERQERLRRRDLLAERLPRLHRGVSPDLANDAELLFTPGAAEPVADSVTDEGLLLLAADRFLVRNRAGSYEILAGYPWLGGWGRDTFQSLEGLLLIPGLFVEAQEVFLWYGHSMRNGLVPTVLPDLSHEPIWVAPDPSLWFVNAVYAFWRHTENRSTLSRELYPLVREILRGFEHGIHGLTRLEEDGLLSMTPQQGDPMLTYGRPRHNAERLGQPVDLNALWYNALRIAAVLAAELEIHNDRARWTHLAAKTGQAFTTAFWLPDAGYLADIRYPDRPPDTSLRVLQLLAVSLPFSPLEAGIQGSVVAAVSRELLTPYGLRSLAPSDPRYVAKFSGNYFQQLDAVFDGAVWPWMMGAYVDATLRVESESGGGAPATVLLRLRALLQPLIDSLQHAGVGNVREIFDGDPPYVPHGCIASARSTAELIRALWVLGRAG